MGNDMNAKWKGYGNLVTITTDHDLVSAIVTVNDQLYAFDTSNHSDPLETAKAFFTGTCDSIRDEYDEQIGKGTPTM